MSPSSCQYHIVMPRQKAVCKFFNSPRGCSNGDDCRFSHSSELDSSSSSVCKYFDVLNQTGCSFGSKCRFVHLNPKPSESGGFQCTSCKKKAFSGVCMGCVNRHPMITRQTSNILRDLAEQSEKVNVLQTDLAAERDDHIFAKNEMNIILDSMQTADAQTQTDDAKQHICGICCDRTISHALVPCGHCFCLVCIEASRRCPVCRNCSESKLTVYF